MAGSNEFNALEYRPRCFRETGEKHSETRPKDDYSPSGVKPDSVDTQDISHALGLLLFPEGGLLYVQRRPVESER